MCFAAFFSPLPAKRPPAQENPTASLLICIDFVSISGFFLRHIPFYWRLPYFSPLLCRILCLHRKSQILCRFVANTPISTHFVIAVTTTTRITATYQRNRYAHYGVLSTDPTIIIAATTITSPLCTQIQQRYELTDKDDDKSSGD